MLRLYTEEFVISVLLEGEENIQNVEKSKRKRFSVHKKFNKRKTEEDCWTLLYKDD
jgi:hypothetical protein